MNFDDFTTAFNTLAATLGTVPSKIGWKFWSNLWLLYDCTSSQESGTQTAVHRERSSYQGLPTKLVTAAWGQMMAAPELPSRMTGGGRGRTQEDELTGPHYQNLPRHAVNSSSVGVQQGKMKMCPEMCQGITSVSALRHCGGLCSHN